MHKPILLLFDGDIIAYQAAVVAQRSGAWDEDEAAVWGYLDKATALDYLEGYIERCLKRLDAKDFVMTLSDKENFRKSVYPQYKSNRGFSCRPIGLEELKWYIQQTYRTYIFPKLEADDVLGILSTQQAFEPEYTKIIVSEDKDLKTIPGHLYDPNKDSVSHISTEEADLSFYCQALAGDVTDGYPGLPGIGMKRAENMLRKQGVCWETVKNAYVKAGYPEEYALQQARCARILRESEWDFEKQEVNLWTP